MHWISIVFMQDSQDFEPANKIYEEGGMKALFDYLMQWYEGNDKDVAEFRLYYDFSPAKDAIGQREMFGDFEVYISQVRGCCGLTKRVPENILQT